MTNRLRMLLLLALLLAPPVAALTVCYDEQALPSVLSIEATPNSVIAVLGGTAWDEASESTAVVVFDGERWHSATRRKMSVYGVRSPTYRACKLDIPLPELSATEAHRLREWPYEPEEFNQKVTACVEAGDFVYFGIGMYEGEGYTGVGGLGRYNTRTGITEVRRPRALRSSSVTAIAYDDGVVWLGTAIEGECSGLIATKGVLRYDWNADRIQIDERFPGFVVHDLAVVNGVLWAASDMGISRGVEGRFGFGWTHWTYTGDPQEPMQREFRRDLYTRLLQTLPHHSSHGGGSPYSLFLDNLFRVRPGEARIVTAQELERLRQAACTCEAADNDDLEVRP